MSTAEIFDKINDVSSLLRGEDFKEKFPQIKEMITQIPGHEDLVKFNEIATLEEWQLSELRTTLLEQLNKTKQMWQNLKNTGYNSD